MDAAAAQYRRALDVNAANLSALLGLERVLPSLDRLPELVPLIQAGLDIQPGNRSIRGLHLRVLGVLGDEAGLAEAARAWIAAVPEDPEPYGEWARALIKRGNAAAATRVLAEGAQAVGDGALTQDMAELSAGAGAWEVAAEQWRLALDRNPALIGTAVASLSEAPVSEHARVIAALTGRASGESGARLAAEVLVSWGRPVEGWRVLERSLPEEPRTVSDLRRFADRVRTLSGPDAAQARGNALERIARMSTGPAAERARIEAAQAFVEAGDRQSAERMLSRLANDAQTGEQGAVAAIATLIRVMAESGRVDEAEERFRQWADRMPADVASGLREPIAWGWIRRGRLDRADSILGADSTVAVLAVRGWVTLYRGDLGTAADLLRSAGPVAGGRQAATERTTVLALLQQVEPDSAPRLGEGLLFLRRADSSRAVKTLEEAAGALPPRGGRADVLELAGFIAVQRGDAKTAERILLAALATDSTGAAAPNALYHLARAYQMMEQNDEATHRLEQLILGYPSSAILPIARRLMDQLRGTVPNG
jgi:tetratricopeptide (TPR) repeat protein